MAFYYHWSKTQIEDETCLDDALYYMDAITRSTIIRNLTDITIACTPHLDKKPRNEIIRGMENRLRMLDNLYKMSNEDDSLPERGAFDKIKKLLNKK